MARKQKTASLFATGLLAAGVYQMAGAPAAQTPLYPIALAASKDGKTLFIACKKARQVALFDIAGGKIRSKVSMPAEPTGLTVSADGARIYVTCAAVASRVVALDASTGKIVDTLQAGHTAMGPALSPDGKTLFVCNRFNIDFPAMLARLAKIPAAPDGPKELTLIATSRVRADVPNDLAFLAGLRQFVKLPEIDRGPRGVVIAGAKAYSANYFSDTLSVIDLSAPVQKAESIALGPKQTASQIRKGEAYFHDASLCFQGWQSCSSCHPGEARADGLNWDLLNDGLGNPKNTRSMLFAHRTPPAMSLGVRDSAETAVRSGLIHILFTEQPEEVPDAIDEYLKSLRPVPSPYLVNGQLSKAALRGREVFNNAKVGCAKCHPAGSLFTNLKQYVVGTSGRFDKGNEEFDTPTLIEVWRTAPYLHDGSAATMRDVLTGRNPEDKHGKTSHLTKQQIDDLAEYLLSL